MKPQPKHQPLYFTPRTPWGTRLPGTSFFDHLKASDAVPLAAPDDKRPLWGKELQGLGGGMAKNQLGGAQGTADGNDDKVWKAPTYVPPPPSGAANPGNIFKEKLPEPKDHPLDRNIPQGLPGQIPAPDSGGPVLKAPPFVRPTYQQVKYRPLGLTDDELIRRQEANMKKQLEQGHQAGLDGTRSMSWTERNDFDNKSPHAQKEEGGPLRRFLNHFDGDFEYEGNQPGTDEPPGKSFRLRFSTNPAQREELPPDGPPEKNQGDEEKWKFLHPLENGQPYL